MCGNTVNHYHYMLCNKCYILMKGHYNCLLYNYINVLERKTAFYCVIVSISGSV